MTDALGIDDDLRTRAMVAMAHELMETPEFETVPPMLRELRALIVAGKVYEALERWLRVSRALQGIEL